eukprot:825292-Prymnesium_polylepis.1
MRPLGLESACRGAGECGCSANGGHRLQSRLCVSQPTAHTHITHRARAVRRLVRPAPVTAITPNKGLDPTVRCVCVLRVYGDGGREQGT